MPDLQTVVAFPGKGSAALQQTDYDCWKSWAECELAILGHDIASVEYDWRQAFESGKKPHEAAAEAVEASTSG